VIGALRRRIEPGDDTGASLVFALILITVVAMVIGALMSFTETSLRVTVSMRSQAADTYGADGAAQAAINQLRRNGFNNNTSSATYPKCFGNTATSDTMALNGYYPGPAGSAAASAAVTCSPDPNTGAGGGIVPITSSNKPGNAILTTGTNPAEDGLHVKALNSTTPFVVHGSVVSNSNINVTNGALQSNGAVYAHTGCVGTIVSTPVPDCGAGNGAAFPYNFEPAYGSPANVVPAYQPVPVASTANCPGKIMTFQPGYYDDASALSALMSGTGSNPCKGSVWWFTPGIYYFDFHNTTDPLLAGSDLWTVDDGQLIAGRPVNGSGTVIAKPTNPSPVPGACQNPIKDTAALGVQFIFGGDSQFEVSGTADAEICGTYQSGRPPIAVYGVTAGSESPVTATSLAATTVTASRFVAPAAPGTLVTGLAAIDAKYDTWTKTASGNQSGTLSLSGFSPPSTIPAGSVLTEAKLRIVYGASAAATSRSVTITPAAGGPVITKTVSASAQLANTTQTVDLLDTTAAGLAASIHSNGFTGASLAYTSTMNAVGDENVDAIQLELTYAAPAFRAENTTLPSGNCLTSTYTGGSAGQCAVLYTPTAYRGAFYIQGTTYVPMAVIDLTLSNITSQVLRFGVVARSLWIKETGSITYSGPVIEVPDNSPGLGPGGTVVYLNVYECPAATSCSSSTGVLRLRARVLIFDPTGVPVPGSRQITIQGWALQR
jgi:hypothetical protein